MPSSKPPCTACHSSKSGTPEFYLLTCSTCPSNIHHLCGPLHLRPSTTRVKAYFAEINKARAEGRQGRSVKWTCLGCLPEGGIARTGKEGEGEGGDGEERVGGKRKEREKEKDSARPPPPRPRPPPSLAHPHPTRPSLPHSHHSTTSHPAPPRRTEELPERPKKIRKPNPPFPTSLLPPSRALSVPKSGSLAKPGSSSKERISTPTSSGKKTPPSRLSTNAPVAQGPSTKQRSSTPSSSRKSGISSRHSNHAPVVPQAQAGGILSSQQPAQPRPTPPTTTHRLLPRPLEPPAFLPAPEPTVPITLAAPPPRVHQEPTQQARENREEEALVWHQLGLGGEMSGVEVDVEVAVDAREAMREDVAMEVDVDTRRQVAVEDREEDDEMFAAVKRRMAQENQLADEDVEMEAPEERPEQGSTEILPPAGVAASEGEEADLAIRGPTPQPAPELSLPNPIAAADPSRSAQISPEPDQHTYLGLPEPTEQSGESAVVVAGREEPALGGRQASTPAGLESSVAVLTEYLEKQRDREGSSLGGKRSEGSPLVVLEQRAVATPIADDHQGERGQQTVAMGRKDDMGVGSGKDRAAMTEPMLPLPTSTTPLLPIPSASPIPATSSVSETDAPGPETEEQPTSEQGDAGKADKGKGRLLDPEVEEPEVPEDLAPSSRKSSPESDGMDLDPAFSLRLIPAAPAIAPSPQAASIAPQAVEPSIPAAEPKRSVLPPSSRKSSPESDGMDLDPAFSARPVSSAPAITPASPPASASQAMEPFIPAAEPERPVLPPSSMMSSLQSDEINLDPAFSLRPISPAPIVPAVPAAASVPQQPVEAGFTPAGSEQAVVLDEEFHAEHEAQELAHRERKEAARRMGERARREPVVVRSTSPTPELRATASSTLGEQEILGRAAPPQEQAAMKTLYPNPASEAASGTSESKGSPRSPGKEVEVIDLVSDSDDEAPAEDYRMEIDQEDGEEDELSTLAARKRKRVVLSDSEDEEEPDQEEVPAAQPSVEAPVEQDEEVDELEDEPPAEAQAPPPIPIPEDDRMDVDPQPFTPTSKAAQALYFPKTHSRESSGSRGVPATGTHRRRSRPAPILLPLRRQSSVSPSAAATHTTANSFGGHLMDVEMDDVEVEPVVAKPIQTDRHSGTIGARRKFGEIGDDSDDEELDEDSEGAEGSGAEHEDGEGGGTHPVGRDVGEESPSSGRSKNRGSMDNDRPAANLGLPEPINKPTGATRPLDDQDRSAAKDADKDDAGERFEDIWDMMNKSQSGSDDDAFSVLEDAPGSPAALAAQSSKAPHGADGNGSHVSDSQPDRHPFTSPIRRPDEEHSTATPAETSTINEALSIPQHLPQAEQPQRGPLNGLLTPSVARTIPTRDDQGTGVHVGAKRRHPSLSVTPHDLSRASPVPPRQSPALFYPTWQTKPTSDPSAKPEPSRPSNSLAGPSYCPPLDEFSPFGVAANKAAVVQSPTLPSAERTAGTEVASPGRSPLQPTRSQICGSIHEIWGKTDSHTGVLSRKLEPQYVTSEMLQMIRVIAGMGASREEAEALIERSRAERAATVGDEAVVIKMDMSDIYSAQGILSIRDPSSARSDAPQRKTSEEDRMAILTASILSIWGDSRAGDGILSIDLQPPQGFDLPTLNHLNELAKMELSRATVEKDLRRRVSSRVAFAAEQNRATSTWVAPADVVDTLHNFRTQRNPKTVLDSRLTRSQRAKQVKQTITPSKGPPAFIDLTSPTPSLAASSHHESSASPDPPLDLLTSIFSISSIPNPHPTHLSPITLPNGQTGYTLSSAPVESAVTAPKPPLKDGELPEWRRRLQNLPPPPNSKRERKAPACRSPEKPEATIDVRGQAWKARAGWAVKETEGVEGVRWMLEREE